MCLILVGWRARPELPLIVAANRDEFHARAAAPAAFWSDQPSVLAGRDLQAGGTWMGVSRSGRFAGVTNYRGAREPAAAHSRGALVTEFLTASGSAEQYVKQTAQHGKDYSGYNLLVSDGEELWWTSNRDGAPRKLEAGIYGLGNLLLDSEDLAPAKARFAALFESMPAAESLFGVLAPAKIVDLTYGTRCSTLLRLGTDRRVRYAERSFAADGQDLETLGFEFSAS
jgi:uncharacterized protein with NRDE domain